MLIPEDASAHLTDYLEQLRARRLSRSLQANASRVLPRLFGQLGEQGVQRLVQVDQAHLTRFARHLAAPNGQGRTLSLASQACYLDTVRGFFAFLEERGTLLRDPATALPRPRVQRLPRSVLGVAQARRLMMSPFPGTVLGLRDRGVLELLYGTGMRGGECERLELGDLDLASQTVLIRNGKGKKDRIVPLTGCASQALDLYLRESRSHLQRWGADPALMLNRFGKRLSLQSIEKLVRKHAAAVGIVPRVTPHTLRHACATHLLRGGADVRHVQALLGHASLRTTALYTRVEITDLRQVLARAHPRERA